MEKEFVSLLNQHRGIIFKICKIYCQKEENRQDLFQEIVLQLWKAFPAFKHDANKYLDVSDRDEYCDFELPERKNQTAVRFFFQSALSPPRLF